jgi:hypothetical protein
MTVPPPERAARPRSPYDAAVLFAAVAMRWVTTISARQAVCVHGVNTASIQLENENGFCNIALGTI